MRIETAQYIGGRLILSTTDPEARRLVYEFKPGEYQLIKAKKRRSLDANAYCWVLCTEIAKAVNVAKEDVYRRNIRDVGEYTPLPIKAEAVDDFKRIWAGHGIGWFVDVIDDTQDAKSVGVDVISDREKSLLLEGWNEKQTDKGT